MKYLGEYYHTRLGAKIALKIWQIKTYKKIEERGDKVLKDDSFIYRKFVWSKPKESNGLFSSGETKIKKWFVFHGVWTQSMIDDIRNIEPIDFEAELVELIKSEIR